MSMSGVGGRCLRSGSGDPSAQRIRQCKQQLPCQQRRRTCSSLMMSVRWPMVRLDTGSIWILASAAAAPTNGAAMAAPAARRRVECAMGMPGVSRTVHLSIGPASCNCS